MTTPSTQCASVCEKSERPTLQLHHRPIEIERKFLVANDEWRQSAVRSVGIRDGLIAVYKDRKVRVRISGDIATVAIKGPRISRSLGSRQVSDDSKSWSERKDTSL